MCRGPRATLENAIASPTKARPALWRNMNGFQPTWGFFSKDVAMYFKARS